MGVGIAIVSFIWFKSLINFVEVTLLKENGECILSLPHMYTDDVYDHFVELHHTEQFLGQVLHSNFIQCLNHEGQPK